MYKNQISDKYSVDQNANALCICWGIRCFQFFNQKAVHVVNRPIKAIETKKCFSLFLYIGSVNWCSIILRPKKVNLNSAEVVHMTAYPYITYTNEFKYLLHHIWETESRQSSKPTGTVMQSAYPLFIGM